MAIQEPSAGELRQRVTFERRSRQGDGYGNAEGDWNVLIASRRAKLNPTRGGEQIIAQRAQGVSAWDCWVHLDAQTARVTTDDRLIDARNPDAVFNIKFVGDMTGRGRWLLMQLELGGAV